LPAAVPQGSIYVWSPVPGGWTAAAFADAVLETAHVSLTPGTFFGRNGEGYVRISLTDSNERIQTAMARLSQALPQLAAMPLSGAGRESWRSAS
jgi:aspartate/methionine/tyrosine aminotransferase